MANRTYISTTTRRSPKPRSERLRAIGAGSVSSTVISLGGSSGGRTAGEDGFSPTISFETEGSVLTVRVVNKTGIKEYEIDLGECTGVDALRKDFEECCREMTEEVKDLRDAIDELKRMMNVVTFTVVPTPADAKVTINGEERASVSVLAGAEVEWRVEADGYITRTGSQTVTEDTTVEVVLADLGSLISSFSYDDIGAGGGSVLPKVEVLEGAALSYSGTGVDKDTGEVSADSLGTTVKARTRVTAVTLTAELNGQTATASADVYQQANEVVRHEAVSWEYGTPSITGGHTYDDISAGGGTVTPTAPAYNQTFTTGYTDTYTSGATAPGEYEDEVIRSGASLTYSGTGVDKNTGEVSEDSLGTTLKDRTKITTATVTVTMNGKSASKSADVYQQANEIVSTSDEETYSTPSVSLSYEVDGVEGADIPAGGGTARPALSYSQTHTTGHSETYTSGEVATDGTTETITSGAEVSYGSVYSYPGAIDPSSGAVTASSLGTTVQGRSISASVRVTVTLNGKSGTAAVEVWQEENRVESTAEETDYEALIVGLTYYVDGEKGADIPASGGTAVPDLEYRQDWYRYEVDTYTSGATASRQTDRGTDTTGGEVGWTVNGEDADDGIVTAPSLGTTVRERAQVASVTAAVTLNGETAPASATVYQQENRVESSTDEETYSDIAITGGFEYDDIGAGGGTVTPTAVTYAQTHTTGHSETYTSGEVATDGTTETITSGAGVTYSGTGVNTSTGSVGADSLGTTVKSRTKITESTVTVTLNGKSAPKSADVYQEENRVESTAESVTYGVVEVTEFSYGDVPAGGGTVYPTVAYRQMSYDTVTSTYTSGSAETSSTEAGYITEGATFSYTGQWASTRGAVSADSLGTTERERTSLGIVYMSVTLNGSRAVAECEVWQQENKIESTTRSRDIERLVVAQFSYPDIPAEGGTVYPETGFWYEWEDFDTYTYTSGESRTEGNGTADVTVTPDEMRFADNTLKLSPITLDTATGAATAEAATSTERQSLTTVTVMSSYISPETGEGLDGTATAGVWQEGREAYLTVTPTTATVDASGGRVEVVVSSSSDWTASSNASWLSVSLSRLLVSINVSSNSTTSERTGTVTVTNDDGLTAMVTVTQSGSTVSETHTLTINLLTDVTAILTLTVDGTPYRDETPSISYGDPYVGEFAHGAVVGWRINATGYGTASGEVTMDSDREVNVDLRASS